MEGTAGPAGMVLAHERGEEPRVGPRRMDRVAREEAEASSLAAGATRARAAGNRARPEEPDSERTCFERDRDRILHSAAFRRLAGKTQAFIFPDDHQRTRLTHALEVAQVAVAVSRATGLNVALTEAIALGHDCGHGPGGHASEDAFDSLLEGGFDHATFGADVVLAPLNLCRETADGIRNHSWSRPVPSTPEGAVVSWADRIAYVAHDLEDAVAAGIVTPADVPGDLRREIGERRSGQLRCFIDALVDGIRSSGRVAMATGPAAALAELRRFNYERIYTRPESLSQGATVVRVLRALVEYWTERPERLASREVQVPDAAWARRQAVIHVAGMTDRYAFRSAVELLGWDPSRLPRGIDAPT